jgi:hypothetical protein
MEENNNFKDFINESLQVEQLCNVVGGIEENEYIQISEFKMLDIEELQFD